LNCWVWAGCFQSDALGGWDRQNIICAPHPLMVAAVFPAGRRSYLQVRFRPACLESEIAMAKKKSMAREYVWLQCTETGDLNYRTEINVKGGIAEKLKEGFMKYSPRLRRHSKHKIKRK
jgi:large subunit ribosomal protein L33